MSRKKKKKEGEGLDSSVIKSHLEINHSVNKLPI